MAQSGEESLAIGIDLGTTNSVVGVWRPEQNRVQICQNESDSYTTPSVVAFTKIIRLVGEAAKNQATTNPSNTIFESKRLIGRNFNDATVQKDIRLWPFKVVPGKDDRPMIQATEDDVEKLFAAEEIATMILQKMKVVAETKLGQKIKNAVITVPAYFNDSQRQATKVAGEMAGLNVLRIITEPTAAAIAYGLQNKMTNNEAEKIILVFDLGGGTLDVSLVTLAKDNFKVKAIAGDTHLGGGDFDNKMVNHFVAEFRKKKNKDISENPKALRRLRDSCEKAKRTLSSDRQTDIVIDSLFEGIDFSSTITRARFENMNKDLFKKCMEQVEKCLKDAKVEKSDVHDVVLVGGSSHIPIIKKLLKAFFDGKELSECVSADEAVATGAAYQAALLSGVVDDNNNDVVIMDVTPLSLGFKLYSGDMAVVIPRNTTYPIKKNCISKTAEDNQTSVRYTVYEGEGPRADDNYLLGSFQLIDIPPRPKGVQEFDICFEIDYDGILTVSAQHVGNEENTKEIAITYDSRRLPKEDIERIGREAVNHAAKEEKRRLAVLAKNALQDYVLSREDSLADSEEILNWSEDISSYAEACVFEKKLRDLQSVGP